MKRIRLMLLFLLGCAAGAAPAPARQMQSFDRDWKFQFGDVPGAERPEWDDAHWRLLDVPHDWSIEGVSAGPDSEGPFDRKSPGGTGAGALNGGIGWYRKSFTLPADAQGQRVFVQFDGVYMDSEVWLNGISLGRHPYGYTSFQYDLTPHVKFGATNILAVRVNVQQPCSRWYSGAGIYRHVRLVLTDPLHIAPWGVYVTTPEVSASEAKVRVRTSIGNTGATDTTVTLSTTLTAPAPSIMPPREDQATHVVPAGGTYEFDQLLKVDNVQRWSVERPALYQAHSVIRAGGQRKDAGATFFGIRTITFTPEDGFLLNGKRVQIHGVCNHHDLGPLGAAVNRRAIERQLEILKGMGCNAIRTSHNPPAPELLDACDRLGFLVMDEAFDEWIIPKSRMKFGYGRFFNEWSERDLVSMLHRDRNHPSVILWSIGNEIKEQAAANGGAMAQRLADICHREDPTRPVTSGCNKVGSAVANGFAKALDVLGLNYFTNEYQAQRGKVLVAAETSSALSSRGEYGLERKADGQVEIRTQSKNQCASYDLDCPGWGLPAEASLLALKNAPWVTGEFVWTGFDYFGEPTPFGWPSRSSYFGIMDLCGFPKDRYYLYQSQWTDQPMVHVLPHWDWPGFEGQAIPVWAYSNGESVELFLNGQSLGAQDRTKQQGLHWEWQVPYVPGELKIVARREGRVVAEKVVRTAGPPAKLMALVDRPTIQADGDDVAFVEVRVVDRDGNVCPNARSKISIRLQGPGTVAGMDNGDPTCHEPIKATAHTAFHGLCLAVIRAGHEPGAIRLTAAAAGLTSADATITTSPAAP